MARLKPKQSALTSDIAREASARSITIAVAESVTAGHIALELASAESASVWFRGGVVAYQTDLKRSLLGVVAERIISATCAAQMAEGVVAITGADISVAVTGVGGPEPEGGEPPGTVFVAVCGSAGVRTYEYRFDGKPDVVVTLATEQALRHLREVTAAWV